MSRHKSREQIQDELDRLMKDEDYKLLRPILDGILPIVNSEVYAPDVADGVLENVKSYQAKIAKGADAYDLIRRVAAADFNQPNMNVEGDLFQAGRDVVNKPERDFINNVTVQIVNNKFDELKREMPNPSIEINFVLLVMSREEAEQLTSGAAFKEYTDQIYTDEFERLQDMLVQKNITDWINGYGVEPQDWKPFYGSTKSIADLITDSLRDIEGIKKPLVPKFIDIRTLNEGTRAARRSLRDLRLKGCVVVMDVISIRHPVIQRAYRGSLLDAFENVMIVRVAPTGDALTIEQQMIRFSEQLIDLEFYKRLVLDRDEKSDQVSDSLYLDRWLVRVTKKLLPDDEKAKGGIRGEMYK